MRLLKQKKVMLAPEDVKKSTDDFRTASRRPQKGGIIGVDSMEDFTPAKICASRGPRRRGANGEIRGNPVLYYWHQASRSLKSSYRPSDQWEAFTKSVIEPIPFR